MREDSKLFTIVVVLKGDIDFLLTLLMPEIQNQIINIKHELTTLEAKCIQLNFKLDGS